MTMVNSTVSSTPNRGGASLRKTNKPLMEKRRRARINDSLSQLKSLVIHSSKKDSSQFSKLEKADILELTVKHLRGLQAQQQQQHLQQQQHHHHQQQQQQQQQHTPSGPADTLMNGKYHAGFVECANEVMRYLDQSQGINHETKTKVVGHLAGCLQLVSATSHNQPKITSQPIPQQVAAPPNNAAAILAAAAAAAGSTTTTTTQLPNGQIIQIVSNPLQNVQSTSGPAVLGLNAPVAQSIQGINLSTHSDQAINQLSQPINSTAQVMSKPLPNQTTTSQQAYIHYAQPLHIQIPPIVSPVLIQKKESQQQQQIKQTELRESVKNFSSSLSSQQSSLPDQVNDIVSSSSSLASSPPSRLSTSPPTLYPGHPKARAQKQLNFYAQEELKLKSDKYSRSLKHSMTPPSSSSSLSSSSSESENTSPLNLSQSPPFYVYKAEQRRPTLFPSGNHKNNEQKQSAYTFPAKSSFHGERLAFKEGGNVSFAPNATSVIVNSRKCADFTEGRYWSMMEEERHCIRRHNTPSPASSVGEERVWRPW